MTKKITRRDAVRIFGAVAGTSLLNSALGFKAIAAETAKGATDSSFPWPYTKLDSDQIAERAYKGYYEGHCMYGAFEAIVGAVADKKGGEPFKSFPYKMMKYGAGGVGDWASLCGALNGAAAAIALFVAEPKPLIDELFGWYEKEPLPNYKPKNPKFDIQTSVAASVLCHQSVTNWCKKAGKKAFSPERSERCAWITASVAKFTTEILNHHFAGTFKAAYPIPADVAKCRGCHDKGGSIENTRGKMGCTSCHPNTDKTHKEL